MNHIIALKWTKLIAYAAAGGLSGVFGFRKHEPATWAVTLMSVAGALGVLWPQPSQAVVQDAKIVTPSGAPTGAINISSTSELIQK
ncbi:MAG TPA: hypothetical protein VHX17_10670 [Candidatus Cybelea sp.]|jgi:hypothetical protein|nr:hypothetical protein [Candidatus Cybelea sp.]